MIKEEGRRALSCLRKRVKTQQNFMDGGGICCGKVHEYDEKLDYKKFLTNFRLFVLVPDFNQGLDGVGYKIKGGSKKYSQAMITMGLTYPLSKMMVS